MPFSGVLVDVLWIEGLLRDEIISQKGDDADIVTGDSCQSFQILIAVLLKVEGFVVPRFDQRPKFLILS